MAIRVLVVDDEALVRFALQAILDGSRIAEAVGEATNGTEAVHLCEALRPDVVFMDIRMPLMNGIEATRRIRTILPDTRVIVITSSLSRRWISSALQAGAAGYLLKDSPPASFVWAVQEVARGRMAMSPEVTREMVSLIRGNPVRESPRLIAERELLTPGERSIVEQLACGKSNGEIASHLQLAEATVKANLHRIMRKWNARDRVQVLIAAVRRGVVAL